MEAPTKPAADPLRDPRVYLAVERTFLAWIRTGLALMGFGFVVARFGLFMRELYATRTASELAPHGISARFGLALVVLGVVLSVVAVARYLLLLKRLDRGDELRKPSRLAIALGASLATIGAIVSAYLLVTTFS